MTQEDREFKSFSEFYPYYLEEHSNPTCRRLHYLGSMLVIAVLLYTMATTQWIYLLLLPVIGYGFAWLGHFFFEKNRPATFKYPLYSLLGDWVMLKDMLTGRIRF
ncbi:Mpo1-like protein [Marinobacter fonticola]|uniref:Mpo1-like protein n=1 Tax=Marinobacter fonticola TaxID=2603215 RepID=UPI0011E83A66|nr:Mpo1-like protein [Marinobacter fonticola]